MKSTIKMRKNRKSEFKEQNSKQNKGYKHHFTPNKINKNQQIKQKTPDFISSVKNIVILCFFRSLRYSVSPHQPLQHMYRLIE